MDSDDDGSGDVPSPLESKVQLRLVPAAGTAPGPDPEPERVQLSGATHRARAEAELAEQAAREQARGLDELEVAFLERLGEPPDDPVQNVEWANRAAVGMAHLTLHDRLIPRELRFKQAARYLDRVTNSTQKTVNARRIREIEEKTGATKKAKAKGDAVSIGAVGGGTALRARGKPKPGAPVSGSVLLSPPEGDGGGTA